MYLAAHGSDQAVGLFGVRRDVNSKVLHSLRSIYYTIEPLGFEVSIYYTIEPWGFELS